MDPIVKGGANPVVNTSGVFKDSWAEGAIIKNVGFTPHGDSQEEPGNTGHTAITVDLDDGWDIEAKFVYDGGIAFPARGDWISVQHPEEDAAVDADVTYVTPSLERGKLGEVTLRARYRPDRPKSAGTGGGAAM
jgi:hypothetical protein